jgi:RNA polymerase sigma-70 factor (ECF subfamily)
MMYRGQAADVLDVIFRRERSQILAVLIRLTDDFTIAEDALQEAFADALKQWPRLASPRVPRLGSPR